MVLILALALSSCGPQVNTKRKTNSLSSQLSLNQSANDISATRMLPLAVGTVPTAISSPSTSVDNIATLTADQKKLLYSNWSNRKSGMTLILSGLDRDSGTGSIYFSLINSASVKACAANAAIAIDKRTTASQIYGNITINGGQSYYWSGSNLALKSDSDCNVFTGRFAFIASTSGFYVEDPNTSLVNQTPLYESSSSVDQLGSYFYKWYNSSSLIVDLSGLSQIGAATHNFVGSDGSQCQSILAIGGREGLVTINIVSGADLKGNVTKACSVRDGAYRVQRLSAGSISIQGMNGPALTILPEVMLLTNTTPTYTPPTGTPPTSTPQTDTPVAVTWTTQEEAVWKSIQAKFAFDAVMDQANSYLDNERNKAIAALNTALGSQASVAPATATSSLKALFANHAATVASMNTWKNVTMGGNWSSTDPAHVSLQAAIDAAYKEAYNAVKALPGGVSGGSPVTWSSSEELAWKSIRARIVYDDTMARASAYVSSERNRANAAYNAVLSSPTTVSPSTATMALKNAIAKNAAAVAAMDTWKNVTKGGNWSSTEKAHQDLQAAINLSYNEAVALAKPR